MSEIAERLLAELVETTNLGRLAKKFGGKGRPMRGKQSVFAFDDKKSAEKFSKAVGGKVLTFKNPTGDDWYEVRILKMRDE